MPLLTVPAPAERHGGAMPQDQTFAQNYEFWQLAHPTRHFRWFDIACGDAEMLEAARTVLREHPEETLNGWQYKGHELHEEFAVKGRDRLNRLGLCGDITSGRLSALTRAVPLMKGEADGVSLVNALHEIGLHEVPDLFLDMLLLRADDGFIFVFDISQLRYDEAELGATPWRIDDIGRFLRKLGALLDFRNDVFVTHKPSRNQLAWYFAIRESHLPPNLRENIERDRKTLVPALHAVIKEIFAKRRDELDAEIVTDGKKMRELQLARPAGEATIAEATQQRVIDVRVRDRWAYEYSIQLMPKVAGSAAR